MKPTESRPAAGHGGHHHDASEMHNEDVAHEHSDINIRAVLGFAAGLAAVTGVVLVLMWGLFVGLERYAASNDPQLSPLALESGRQPPEPRLLTDEPAALRKLQDAAAQRLRGSGWVNEAAGIAHMPIEEAKKKIVERGLPSRASGPVDASLGTWAPSMGESSSGRVLGRPAPAVAPIRD